MKPKSLDEIEAMLATESFRTWWVDLDAAKSKLRELEQRRERLFERAYHLELDGEREQKRAIDSLQDSSGEEAEIAALEAEASSMENQSLEVLGGFEEQRFRTSDSWVRLGAVEKHLEEARERLAAAKSAKSGDVSRIEAELARLVREQRAAHEAYERESERKARLWKDVETLWDKSFELGLRAAEWRCATARVKRDSERLFRSSEQKNEEARSLREEVEILGNEIKDLEERISGYLVIAREELGAVSGREFLYWPCKEQEKQVWCLSLGRDGDSYNIEVEPKGIYRASAESGVSRLEPLGSLEEGAGADDRIEAYFRGDENRGRAAAGARGSVEEAQKSEEKKEPEDEALKDPERSSTGKAAGG